MSREIIDGRVAVNEVERRYEAFYKILAVIHVKARNSRQGKVRHSQYVLHFCRNCDIRAIGLKSDSSARTASVERRDLWTDCARYTFGHSSVLSVFMYKTVNAKRLVFYRINPYVISLNARVYYEIFIYLGYVGHILTSLSGDK